MSAATGTAGTSAPAPPAAGGIAGPVGSDLAAELPARRWRFGPPGAPPDATQLILWADGRIGGSDRAGGTLWSLADGALLFWNRDGLPLVRFDALRGVDDDLWTLEGRHLASGAARVLQQTTAEGAFAGRAAATDPRRVGPVRARRFLLVVRGGFPPSPDRLLDRVRHVDPEARGWDLCLSSTGDGLADAPAPCDWFVAQPGLGTYAALHRLLHPRSPLWAYRYVMLAEDDLPMPCADLDRMFCRMVEGRLPVARPAAFPHDADAADTIASTATAFRRDVLRALVPAFGHAISGRGLDQVAGFLAGDPLGRIATVHDVRTHAPPRPARDRALEQAEQRVLHRLYGLPADA